MEVKRRVLLVVIFVVDGVWGVDWMTVWERWVDGGNSFVSVSVCGSRAFIPRDTWTVFGILSSFSSIFFS